MSVSPPDPTAILPRFSSPSESMAEAGSRTVALHRFPEAALYLAFCGFRAGYAATSQRSREKEGRGISTNLIDNAHEFRLILGRKP